MTIPSRPSRFQQQGPATSCVVKGKALGWLSCTSYAFGMAGDKSSINRWKPTGCDFRASTGDTIGGTTIPQNVPLAVAHGLPVEQHTGGNVASLWYVGYQLALGRAVVLQGNTSALIHSPHRSTRGAVNHAVEVNEVRGGTPGDPEEALVYDPAADGDKHPWGTADQGPSWWPWALVKAFAGALKPYGDNDSRLLSNLSPGRAYCAIFPDTEPHVHLMFKGTRSSPFPDAVVVRSPAAGKRVNVRRGPGTNFPLAVDGKGVKITYKTGTPWVVEQVTHGEKLAGSDLWAGDHNGNRWIHSSGLKGLGV